MPFAGDAASLAGAVGFRVDERLCVEGNDPDPRTGDYPIVFRRSDATLRANAITNGRGQAERVDSIVSFTGSAFYFFSGRGDSLMVLAARHASAHAEGRVAVRRTRRPTSTAEAFFRAPHLSTGKGRVAMFGEAAMFTAQRKGAESVPMGMNAPEASQNPQFILNVLHWLVKVLP